jgi:hypothetical protein
MGERGRKKFESADGSGNAANKNRPEGVNIMKHQLCILMLVVCVSVLGCQSSILSSLAKEQAWSENYALLNGATCTSELMVDGDLKTIGQSSHQIILTLPTRKSIHRIVIRGTNIEDVIVYAGTGGEGFWKVIKQVKNNRNPTIDLRVTTATDRLRFRVGGTFDDQRQAGRYDPNYDAMVNRQVKRGRPIAQEIEVYGFADKGN